MSGIIVRVVSWCALVVMLFPAVSAADQFHYINLLVGDRATGMGGAYTAISDDVSGLYYNPAGIAYSTGRNLSASVNAYYNMSKEYENVIGGQAWKRQSSSLLPNFFGVIQPLGKYKVGFSYAVPDSSFEDQSQVFNNVSTAISRYVINFNNEDTTYNFGPSISAEIGKDFSAGATLYLFHRRNKFILNQLVNFSTGQFEWTNRYYEIIERGLRPVLGVMWSPKEKLSIGLSVSQNILYGTSVNVQDTQRAANVTDVNTITFNTYGGPNVTKKYPVQVRGGVAYFVSPELLLSGDVIYSASVSDPNFGDKVAVVNGAVGAEYFLSKNWAIRGGLFTDMANTPEVKSGRINQEEHVDLYGLSLSTSNFTRNTSITLGTSITKGKGDAQIIGDVTDIQTVNVTTWMVFLSSTYSY